MSSRLQTAKKILLVSVVAVLVILFVVIILVVGAFIKYDTIDYNKATEYLKQSNELAKQGKLVEAIEACETAATYWDEEGAVSYECMRIREQLYGTSTPYP